MKREELKEAGLCRCAAVVLLVATKPSKPSRWLAGGWQRNKEPARDACASFTIRAMQGGTNSRALQHEC